MVPPTTRLAIEASSFTSAGRATAIRGGANRDSSAVLVGVSVGHGEVAVTHAHRLPDAVLVPGERRPVAADVAGHPHLAGERLGGTLPHEVGQARIRSEVPAVDDGNRRALREGTNV